MGTQCGYRHAKKMAGICAPASATGLPWTTVGMQTVFRLSAPFGAGSNVAQAPPHTNDCGQTAHVGPGHGSPGPTANLMKMSVYKDACLQVGWKKRSSPTGGENARGDDGGHIGSNDGGHVGGNDGSNDGGDGEEAFPARDVVQLGVVDLAGLDRGEVVTHGAVSLR